LPAAHLSLCPYVCLAPYMCARLSVSLPAAHLSLCPHVCLAPCTVCVQASLSLCLLHIYSCAACLPVHIRLFVCWLLKGYYNHRRKQGYNGTNPSLKCRCNSTFHSKNDFLQLCAAAYPEPGSDSWRQHG
jgi:hypothetical protein